MKNQEKRDHRSNAVCPSVMLGRISICVNGALKWAGWWTTRVLGRRSVSGFLSLSPALSPLGVVKNWNLCQG